MRALNVIERNWSVLWRRSHEREKFDECGQLLFVQMPKASLMFGGSNVIEIIYQALALFSELSGDLAAVGRVARSHNEIELLHAIEQPRDVGHARQQPITQLVPTQPRGRSTAKYTKHVELRGADAIRLEYLLKGITQCRVRAHDVEMRLLVEVRERLALLAFRLQRGGHAITMRVPTSIVKTLTSLK